MKMETSSRHVPETWAHWTMPTVDGHHPQMSMIVGEQKFHLLVDSRSDRKRLSPLGVDHRAPHTGSRGRTHYQETIALMRQVSPDGEQGRICPLVAENLADNLLG